MRQLIIYDNQDITRAGLLYFSGLTGIFDPVRIVSDKREITNLLSSDSDSVVILDYSLGDFTGVEELLIFSDRFPKTNWLLFSEELSTDFLKRVLFSNRPFGAIQKDCSEEDILSALKHTAGRERYICNRITNKMIYTPREAMDKKEHILTQTEKEILKEIAIGRTTKEIAARRNLSFHTVNTHRKNIFRKLDVNNVHEAVRYALKAGIVDMVEYYI